MAARRQSRSQFGQVRKLPSGRFQARYSIPGTDTRVNAPHTFDTKGDAETWLATIRTDQARGAWQPPKPKAKPLTFTEYATRWLAERDLKPRTRDHYQTLLAKFLNPEFGTLAVGDITPERVGAWYATLQTGKTYRAHAYSLLRTITRDAVTQRLIDASPCIIRGAGRSPKRKITPRLLTNEELAALTGALPDPYALMVPLAAWCACRFGEITALRREDIDVDKKLLRVRQAVTWVDNKPVVGTPKSDAGKRTIDIPEAIIPAIKLHLRRHVAIGRDALLFPGGTGGYLPHGTFQDWWHAARDAASLPELRFHDLRHHGLTSAAIVGASLKELMVRGGHSTISAALVYQSAAQDRGKIIADRLSKIAERR